MTPLMQGDLRLFIELLRDSEGVNQASKQAAATLNPRFIQVSKRTPPRQESRHADVQGICQAGDAKRT